MPSQAEATAGSIDATGRAIPRSVAEQRRHAEAAIRALKEIDAMGDEAEQRATLDALAREVDADRTSSRDRFGR